MEKEKEGEMRVCDLDSSLYTSKDTEPPSSDGQGVDSIAHSGLDMPLFSSRTMKLLFTKCIAEAFPSMESRKQVMRGQTMSAVNARLLNAKSHLIVEMISHEVLRAVVPQVFSQEDSNNLRYTYVSEGDILYCLGYSLDMGIRAALRLIGPQYCVLVGTLRQLIAVEVVNTVNCSLDLITDPNAIEVEPHVCVLIHPQRLVNLFALILMSCDPKRPVSCNILGCSDHAGLTTSQTLKEVLLVGSSHRLLDYDERELLARDRSFITKFVLALVTCITAASKTSMYDLDLKGTVARLEECTVGKLSSTFPKNMEQIHITVFKKLCRDFGCAKQQHAAIVSSDRQFEQTVVRLLKEQLQRPKEDSFEEKVRGIFKRRSRKVSPDFQKAGSTRPAFIKMLSSKARFGKRLLKT